MSYSDVDNATVGPAMLSDAAIGLLAREVVDELYDCVFDPSGWRRVIRAIGLAAAEFRPILMVETSSPLACRTLEFESIDPAMVARYVSEFVDDNPFRASPVYVRRNKVGLSTDYISQEEVVRTRFHADLWGREADVRVASANILASNAEAVAILAFHYDYDEQHQSLPAGMMFHRMIGPHAERAFALAVRGASLARHTRAADLLASLDVAALVLDGRGRLLRANAAAEALLAATTDVALDRKGTLVSPRPADDAAVGATVAGALKTRRARSVRLGGADGGDLELTAVPVVRRETNDAMFEAFVARAEPALVLYLQPV